MFEGGLEFATSLGIYSRASSVALYHAAARPRGLGLPCEVGRRAQAGVGEWRVNPSCTVRAHSWVRRRCSGMASLREMSIQGVPDDATKKLMLVAVYIGSALRPRFSRGLPFIRQLARVLRRGPEYIAAVRSQVESLLQVAPDPVDNHLQLGTAMTFGEHQLVLDEDESWWSDVKFIEGAAPRLLGDVLEVVGGRDAPREILAIFVQLLEDRELRGLPYKSEVADSVTSNHMLEPLYPTGPDPQLWSDGRVRYVVTFIAPKFETNSERADECVGSPLASESPGVQGGLGSGDKPSATEAESVDLVKAPAPSDPRPVQLDVEVPCSDAGEPKLTKLQVAAQLRALKRYEQQVSSQKRAEPEPDSGLASMASCSRCQPGYCTHGKRDLVCSLASKRPRK